MQLVSRLVKGWWLLDELFPVSKKRPERITNWEELTFGIQETNGHVKHVWRSSTQSWDAGRFIPDPYVNLHVHAGVLHYGMTLFEGCKAFRCKDGKIRVCNLNENSARMNTGAQRLVMAPVPQKMFNDAIDWAVCMNAEFVPPYGTGGSMYIRPFLMGSGPILGLQPCPEFTFMVSVTPVGNYFGNGPVQAVHASVSNDFDRAAPRGTGDVKAGGNYAADLLPLKIAKAEGFGTTLYLDAAERKYVEEFSLQLPRHRRERRLRDAVVVVDPAVDHEQDADAAGATTAASRSSRATSRGPTSPASRRWARAAPRRSACRSARSRRAA